MNFSLSNRSIVTWFNGFDDDDDELLSSLSSSSSSSLNGTRMNRIESNVEFEFFLHFRCCLLFSYRMNEWMNELTNAIYSQEKKNFFFFHFRFAIYFKIDEFYFSIHSSIQSTKYKTKKNEKKIHILVALLCRNMAREKKWIHFAPYLGNKGVVACLLAFVFFSQFRYLETI